MQQWLEIDGYKSKKTKQNRAHNRGIPQGILGIAGP